MPQRVTRRESVAAAVTWLCAQQSAGGWWTDYPELPSDEYVTAFVCARLAGVEAAADCVSAGRGALLDRLRYRAALGHSAGWGWGWWYPTDGDSTSIALAQCREQMSDQQVFDVRNTLARGRRPDGQAAYSEIAELAQVTGLSQTADFSGWTQATICVTAVAAQHDPSLAPVLAQQQQSDGSWASYYWADPAYVTAMAASAVSAVDPDRLRSAADWARQPDPGDLTDFGVAWRTILLRWADRRLPDEPHWGEAAHEWADTLAGRQGSDGAWSPGAVMGVPGPAVRSTDYGVDWERDDLGLNLVLTDAAAIMTTASAVAALAV